MVEYRYRENVGFVLMRMFPYLSYRFLMHRKFMGQTWDKPRTNIGHCRNPVGFLWEYILPETNIATQWAGFRTRWLRDSKPSRTDGNRPGPSFVMHWSKP